MRSLEEELQSEKSERAKQQASGYMYISWYRRNMHSLNGLLQNTTSQIQAFATWLHNELNTTSTVRLIGVQLGLASKYVEHSIMFFITSIIIGHEGESEKP